MEEEFSVRQDLNYLMESSKARIWSKDMYLKDAESNLAKKFLSLRTSLKQKITNSNNQELLYLAKLLLGSTNSELEEIETLIYFVEKVKNDK